MASGASNWRLALLPAGAIERPSALPAGADWLPAIVPGTLAQSLEALGHWDRREPTPLHDRDVWYLADVVGRRGDRLHFDGLANCSSVFLDDALCIEARSMFSGYCLELPADGRFMLAIHFHSLDATLARIRGPRARWRSAMMSRQDIRHIRTTPLGFMPGWSPAIDTVGPWRPIRFVACGEAIIEDVTIRTSWEAGTGRLILDGFTSPSNDGPICLRIGNRVLEVRCGENGRVHGDWRIEGVAPWFPHTHGAPTLHDLDLLGPHGARLLARVGFRTVTIDRGPDGRSFGLIVNGEPVFSRGAVWTPSDPVSLAGDPSPALEAFARAGLNMVRISGAMVPETEAFHDACDRLGIMVWHDLPFANFDYPFADPAFAALAEADVRALTQRLGWRASTTLFCGGSEIAQQAAMMGLAPEQAAVSFLEETTPGLISGFPYIPHSPWGGALPFETKATVTHYFGVGAYRRPVEDVRRAEVRFASECLAFANIPSAAVLKRHGLHPGASHWKKGVPRDLGATWDFEDVRDHYLAARFGIDPKLKCADPDRYLAISRMVSAELMEASMTEWRRPGSPTRGGLVWFARDLAPGAGWGLLDSEGFPKPALAGLARACQPVMVGFTDEGQDGLAIHCVNDGAAAIEGKLTLSCWSRAATPVATATLAIAVPARSGVTLSSGAILGRFIDVNHAYRFGPPTHDVVTARFATPKRSEVTGVFVLPGRALEAEDIGLRVTTIEPPAAPGAPWTLWVAANRFAHFVTIEDEHGRSLDDGLHILPGETAPFRLAGSGGMRPKGLARALNSPPVAYEASA